MRIHLRERKGKLTREADTSLTGRCRSIAA